MRVIIAGGGTGGLAAAIALRKAGLEALVLEQAPEFTAIGAGLGLYANAMKALSYLGADTYWRQTAARIDVSEQRGLGERKLPGYDGELVLMDQRLFGEAAQPEPLEQASPIAA